MILYKYILRNHLAPFFFSAVTLMGIFLLQFLMKFADRLVGKGLGIWVIIKLIVFNLSWMVVLVIPMATLVATLMAFGNMSQNNEITIIKNSGASLYRMMAAPLAASIVLAYLLFVFNNDVLPDANHQAKVLMEDISRQKPTLSLEPGIFSQEIPNYAILAKSINEKTNELADVVIYDYSDPVKVEVVTARKGKIYFSKDQSKLIMDLYDGEIHESDIQKQNLYRRLIFVKHRITMPADQFTFQQSSLGGNRGERELSIQAMNAIIDSLGVIGNKYQNELAQSTHKYLFTDSIYIPAKSSLTRKDIQRKNKLIYSRIIDQIRSTKNVVVSSFNRLDYIKREIDKYSVEVYKKYSIPAACIIFILIGAPLGVMVRKGGFGVAASISLFFFLIYWAFLIGGEKLAEREFFSPFWGMWSANIFLGIIGIVLTIKTNQETVTVNFNFVKRIIPKQWRSLEEEPDENNR